MWSYSTGNMARFYVVLIGTTGQSMTHHFEREQYAVVCSSILIRQKRNRGYVTVGE